MLAGDLRCFDVRFGTMLDNLIIEKLLHIALYRNHDKQVTMLAYEKGNSRRAI